MTLLPLDSTHTRNTSDVECHHRLWTARTIGRRRACHAIIAFGQHTRSNDIRHSMPSSPLGSTNGRRTSRVACHNLLWAAQTYEEHHALHDIIALGLHVRSDDVRCGMISPPLDSTHGRQRRAWHDITALGQHTWLATSGMA